MDNQSERLLKFLKGKVSATELEVLKEIPEAMNNRDAINSLVGRRIIRKFVNKMGKVSYRLNLKSK